MSVSHLFYGNKLVDVNHRSSNGQTDYDIKDDDFSELLKMMALGSKASF